MITNAVFIVLVLIVYPVHYSALSKMLYAFDYFRLNGCIEQAVQNK